MSPTISPWRSVMPAPGYANSTPCQQINRSKFTTGTVQILSPRSISLLIIRLITNPKNVFLQQIAEKTVQDVMHILPEELPLGLRHGDYGMSNILAGVDGKITVVDTPAICHAPIYEDLAYLLVALKAKWSQVLSQKLAFNSKQFALYEREFLSGYFGQSPIPYRIIRLYQVQTLLVRWSS
jgi:hypothetical protein